MKIVRLVYKVKGDKRTGKFIKTSRGYIPVEFDDRCFLDKSLEIVEEEEITFDYRSEPYFV